MITSPQTMSAAEAGSYYYETAEHGTTWGGELAKKLGIEGNCTQEQFQKMILGFHPNTGQQLAEKTGEERRAGADYTFSMSKNASILAFFDPRIGKAFNESVNETLKIMEERYAGTRIRTRDENGRDIRVMSHTQNLIWTIFPHFASSVGDPQVHLHIFIHNITLDPRGNMQSVEYRELYANKTYMGALQESNLAQKLKNLGYEIEVDRTKGIADIKLDKTITRTFSTMTKDINIKEAELREEYPNMSRKAIRQLADKLIRPLKEHNPTQEETKEFIKKKTTPEQLEIIKGTVERAQAVSAEQKESAELKQEGRPAQNAGFGTAESPEKKTETLEAAENPEVKKEKKEMFERKAVKIGTKDITETARYFRYERLENVVLRHTFMTSNVNSIASAIYSREDKELIKLEGTKYYTTGEVIKDVRENYLTVKENILSKPIADAKTVEKHIEKYQNEHGRIFTSSQNAFAVIVLTGKYKFYIVQGDAGVGKTTAMKIINNVAESMGYKTIGVAHTGKAKEKMQDADVRELYTVAKLQGLVKDGKITIDKNTVLIVDEASMISDRQAKFLNGLDAAKIIYTGDVKQFPSIERGEFFKEAQQAAKESGLNVFTNMDQAVRFTGIQKKVAAALSDKKYEEAYELIKAAGNVKEFYSPEMKITSLINDYVAGVKEGRNIIIIVDTNAERNVINAGVKESLVRENVISAENEKAFTVRETLNILPENRMFVESYQTERLDKNGEVVKNSTILVGKKGEEFRLKDINKEDNALVVTDKNGELKEIEITNRNKDDYLVYTEKDIKLSEGDKIVFLKNNKELGVQNGEIATVTRVEDGVLDAVKPHGEFVRIDVEKYNNMDYGYAVTGHKFQGEDINEVKYSADKQISGRFENNFYTVGTRAIEKVEIYGTNKEIEAFEEAVKNTADSSKTHEYISELVFKEAMSEEHMERIEEAAHKQEREIEMEAETESGELQKRELELAREEQAREEEQIIEQSMHI